MFWRWDLLGFDHLFIKKEREEPASFENPKAWKYWVHLKINGLFFWKVAIYERSRDPYIHAAASDGKKIVPLFVLFDVHWIPEQHQFSKTMLSEMCINCISNIRAKNRQSLFAIYYTAYWILINGICAQMQLNKAFWKERTPLIIFLFRPWS